MVALTDSAKDTIRTVLTGNDQGATGLRIVVNGGGCSAPQYQMGLVRNAGEDDTVVEFDDVKLVLDSYSYLQLAGVTVDFIDTGEGGGFRFDNPAAATGCASCSSSGSGSCN